MCGVLCAADGCPVALEVFAGNTADPTTVGSQVHAIRKRFGISQVALVGDRGMLTTARLGEDLSPASLDRISALKSSDIRPLLKPPEPAAGQEASEVGKAPSQLAALVPDQVAEIRSPEFPGKRLLVCRNPRLQQECAREREELLRATERILEQVAAKVRRGRQPRQGPAAINRRLGLGCSSVRTAVRARHRVTSAPTRWRGRRSATTRPLKCPRRRRRSIAGW